MEICVVKSVSVWIPTMEAFYASCGLRTKKPGNPITKYRTNVHVFSNGPNPAVATVGLRKTAADGEEEYGKDDMKFVHRNFYVDDGLASTPIAKQAIALVTATQATLHSANLRLHKIVSNSIEVMEVFPVEDRGKGVRDLDLRVLLIRKISSPEQWAYVNTSKYPADLATRPLERTQTC